MSIRCPTKDLEAVLLYLISKPIGSIVDTRIGALKKTGGNTFKLTSSSTHDLAVAEALCAHDNFDISSIFDNQGE